MEEVIMFLFYYDGPVNNTERTIEEIEISIEEEKKKSERLISWKED